jgi:hypothetical protein
MKHLFPSCVCVYVGREREWRNERCPGAIQTSFKLIDDPVIFAVIEKKKKEGKL